MSDLVKVAARRSVVEASLADAFANDLFDVDEFERRSERVQQCTSVAELDAVIADLPSKQTSQALTHPASAAMVQVGSGNESGRVTTLLSSVAREGRWTVPVKLKVRNILGSAKLDFRDAVFSAATTEIRLGTVLGSVEIIVPPDLEVDLAVSAILGSVESRLDGTHAPPPGAPRLRISGQVILGSVDVKCRPRSVPKALLSATP
ncbi:MAG TPA: LiaF-related protein [Kofleriaceae bacterium]|nr:LiaF-related protein [Kofleriaceae bacterium]